MKKTLLSIGTTVILMSSFAQVSINLDGASTDISGTVQNAPTITGGLNSQHLLDFIINNETGADQDWLITRSILNETSGWSNYLCWGPHPGLGNCYPEDPALIWSCGDENIVSGGAGKLSTYVNAPTNGSATYRYYVSDDGVNFLDSVDVQVSSTASIDEMKSIDFSLSPNPSKSYVKIKLNGLNSASINLIDVLGNVVLNSVISSSKTINVSEFKNGIYFLRIDADGLKPITRKLIVRH